MFPFSGSGNVGRCCFQPWVCAAGGTLTFLKSPCNSIVLAPFLDQALVSGRFVTHGEVVDDRLVQLQTTETSTRKN